jgi:hypothetical protein
MRYGLVILAWLVCAFPLEAAPRVDFPYDATVESEEAYVRSGPGSKYYPTGKLKKGQRVTVKRHDPGGWHMIVPPPGSFSWVPAKYVDKTAGNRGTINHNGVAARVGSFESDIRELFQRKFAQGDEVEVLGEKQLMPEAGKGGPELWYRIAPPPGEWRWVSGQALSPAPRDGEPPVRVDPFETESSSPSRSRSGPPVPVADEDLEFEKPVPIDGGNVPSSTGAENPSNANSAGSGANGIKERPLVRREGKLPPVPHAEAGPRVTKRLNEHLDELDRLDGRFRAILDQEPLEWNFDQLEKDYKGLRDDVDTPNLQQMVDTRLTRISDYRKVRSEHQAAADAAAAVVRKDAELLELQKQQEARLAGMRQPRFDGAGILQRSPVQRPGAPRYVLIAPGGKLLAYVVAAPGMNIEPWVGRPVGLTGSRVRHPDLKTDLITVIRVTPVRLSQ